MSNRTLAAFAAAAILVAGTGAAVAGECPADKVLKQAAPIEDAPDIGVDRPILAMVDLTGWRGQGNFMLRLRKLTIAAHGVVPTHTHDDRPSIVHIVEGEIVEHNAFCAVPILHKAGDTTPESGAGHVHWWENKTDKPVIIFSTDVVPFEMEKDKNM